MCIKISFMQKGGYSTEMAFYSWRRGCLQLLSWAEVRHKQTKGKFLLWMWCTPSQRANTSQLTESYHFVSLTPRSYIIIWKDCTFLTNAAGMGCHAVPKEPMAACCVCALHSGSADCPPRNAAVCEAAVSKIASSELRTLNSNTHLCELLPKPYPALLLDLHRQAIPSNSADSLRTEVGWCWFPLPISFWC